MVIWFRNNIAEKCFRDATAVLPICRYLEDIVNEHHPKQKTFPFLEGISADNWYDVEGMKLKHPCVGLLQGADWWGKTKELLIVDIINAATVTSIYNSSPPDIRFAAENFTKHKDDGRMFLYIIIIMYIIISSSWYS